MNKVNDKYSKNNEYSKNNKYSVLYYNIGHIFKKSSNPINFTTDSIYIDVNKKIITENSTRKCNNKCFEDIDF